MHKTIGRLDHTNSVVEKVAEDVVQNDTQVKTTLRENDARVKAAVQQNDSDLKEKLKALETIVTEQGLKIAHLEAVGPSAAAAPVPPATPVGDPQLKAAIDREPPMIRSRLDSLESRATTSISDLQTTVHKIQHEAMPQQVNDMMNQMTTMASKLVERLDKLERERVRGG